MSPTRNTLAFLIGLISVCAVRAEPLLVDTKNKPADADWRARPTRTVEALTGFTPAADAVATSRWGGWLDHRVDKGTGFFRVARAENGRWWFVDPEGYRFLHAGVAGVYRGTSDIAFATTREKFSDDRAWADFTLRLLRETGFNGLGGWTDRDGLAGHPALMPYTISLDCIADFGRSLGIAHLNPGQTGYVNEVPPILHPSFPDWCEQYFRKRVAQKKDDPMLLGYFSDNELPLRRDLLDRSLALDSARQDVAPLRLAALDWLRARRGPDTDPAAAPTDEERVAFLSEVCERYFSNVGAALRRHAPNQLYLGSRFHSKVINEPAVFKAAGRHLDVVSVNLYNTWEIDRKLAAMWTAESGRPVIITEFYAKGMDTGMENVNGAGWVVKTQHDRGEFYQNFVLGLLETGTVVGWHWFKYRDNEPFDTTLMKSNRDSNKGLVAWDYSPYPPLLARMSALNSQVYPLSGYFDRAKSSGSAALARPLEAPRTASVNALAPEVVDGLRNKAD